MEKCRFSDGSLPCGLNSDPDMQANEGGGRDHSNVMDSRSKATTDLKDTLRKLSNTMVPHEEDNLILNKKENKARKHEASCHDYSLTAKPTRQCPFEIYLQKCTQLEKENLEVKKKLKKTETYSKECTTELQRFVKRFKEFKNINKDLDSKNKHLLIKNQQMRQRITEVLKQNRPQSTDLRVPKCCEHHCQEKQQLRETVVVLKEGLENLTEPVESQRLKEDSESIKERKIVTRLQQENQTLRERLDHNCQVIKDTESRAERVQQELDELECCLLTVQTERNLLRQEVKRLHKEYISLTNSISLQLKGNNKAAGLTGFSGKPHESNALQSTIPV
ncbi:227 kDa spindle- and centromere-associated protein [Megalobrama amblycephala]|uniref:227 kDa spindle- and centromere-associated protein n=1 Tax=Megalobrama amblycephala TaxID=75352 RepID=UPI0020142A6A|nr:227 kDa spindle- and centromere-associated protein [Megalobrama amblycephala]XP_048051477.1 227 kDa spindle- and centromere-associated protein [Megalobrama amblycephala]